MDETYLKALLDQFPRLKLLVIGDFFLDKYLDLDRRLSETSLETGLEAYQVVKVRCSPGAAGTVTNNLRALDVQVTALGVIGEDGEGYDMKRALIARGVDVGSLLVHPDRVTPTYMKPMMHETTGQSDTASVHELNRMDIKNRAPLPEAIQTHIIEKLHALAPTVDGIIVADQVPETNCGVITDRVRDALTVLGKEGKIIAVDSRKRIGHFRHVMLKPNVHEALEALKDIASGTETIQESEPEAMNNKEHVYQAGHTLYERTQRPVFITVGAEGVLVFTASGMHHVPGVQVTGPIDIVGAGDSVMAGIVSALCAGAQSADAALVGNLVASITIQQIGTTGTASRQQVLTRFRENFIMMNEE
jgi:rfaE bifunctional protein kinase chain/domain